MRGGYVYLIPNEETESYITAREEVRNAIAMHYEKNGECVVEAGDVGSQDEEYLIVEGTIRPFRCLHYSAMARNHTVADFIKQIES